MDNTVINDDSTFQRIKAKYLETKCHKHYSSVENMATAAAIQYNPLKSWGHLKFQMALLNSEFKKLHGRVFKHLNYLIGGSFLIFKLKLLYFR